MLPRQIIGKKSMGDVLYYVNVSSSLLKHHQNLLAAYSLFLIWHIVMIICSKLVACCLPLRPKRWRNLTSGYCSSRINPFQNLLPYSCLPNISPVLESWGSTGGGAFIKPPTFLAKLSLQRPKPKTQRK